MTATVTPTATEIQPPPQEPQAPAAPAVLRHCPKLNVGSEFTQQMHPELRSKLMYLLRENSTAFWNSLSDVLVDYGLVFNECPDKDDEYIDFIATVLGAVADATEDAGENRELLGDWAFDLAHYALRYHRPEGWTPPRRPRAWCEPDNILLSLDEAIQIFAESAAHDQMLQLAQAMKISERAAAGAYIRACLGKLREPAAEGTRASAA